MKKSSILMIALLFGCGEDNSGGIPKDAFKTLQTRVSEWDGDPKSIRVKNVKIQERDWGTAWCGKVAFADELNHVYERGYINFVIYKYIDGVIEPWMDNDTVIYNVKYSLVCYD